MDKGSRLHWSMLRVIASMAMATFLSVGGCSNGGGGGGTVTSCPELGCDCVFNHQCDDGLFCVNGTCAAENPLADAGGGGDLGAVDGAGGGDGTADGAGDAGGADGVEPGALGDPCGGNGDCQSGWCVDSPEGGYCTSTCEEGCPEGWVCKVIPQTAPDDISVCVLDKARLCQPCEADIHCGDVGDLCLSLGGGNFCGRDCTLDPCPEGYLCQTLDGGAQQCTPVNGSCDCDEDSIGAVKGCQRTNGFGTCFGQETCDPGVGWTGCTAPEPSDEACNGADDDCDGQTDEDFDPTPCEVANEHGICSGVQACLGAAGWVCSAKTPGPETCNGLDDDCDLDVDEGFLNDVGQYAHVEHCGTCGNSCAAKYAGADEVICDDSGWEPVCVLVSCLPGYVKFGENTCLDEDAFLCTPCQSDADCFGALSRCLQVSDTDPRSFCFRDCSGQSEFSETCPEGYGCEAVGDGAQCLPWNDSCDCLASNVGQTKACSQENSFGICFGQEVCDLLAGWTDCTAAIPGVETCNGVDDDCDGMLDEDIDAGGLCEISNEHGTCGGVEICAGAAGVICDAQTPAAESCNGVDDDCDGTLDEGFAALLGVPPVLKYGLSTEHCGACGYACPPVTHGTPACDPAPVVPLCVVGSCDEGYFDYLGVACLPIPTENLCAPCTTDAECQGPMDACIPGEPVGWCARDCAPGSIYDGPDSPCTLEPGQGCCPEGFECSQFGAGRQCVPVSGTCTCVLDGLVESCSVTNPNGTCFGSRVCDLDAPLPGWTDCDAPVPSPELCNGIDDDCDGVIDGQDDSLDPTSTPDGLATCSTGPACTGNWVCLGGAWSCDAKPALDEVCNGLDDDCDGAADEDFLDGGLYLHPSHCGGCGYDCEQLIPGAIDPVCTLLEGSPTCVTDLCGPGTFPFGNGQVCMTLPDNLCQPCTADSNCLVPGSACMDFGDESFCGRSCAPGSPYGTACPDGYSCEAYLGGSQCLPASGSCVCGADTVGLVRSCTVGACAGQQVCQFTGAVYVFSPCSAEGLVPEVCDGADNDCDGQVDEGYLGDGGVYDTDQDCGVCGNDCTAQLNPVVHHGAAVCDGAGMPPSCVIGECLTETIGGAVYEWVDVNAVLDDGCECLRPQGNTDDDPPDVDFFDGEALAYPAPVATYVDGNCDGVDGVVADALFVSAAAGPGGDGSRAAPFQTIQEALDADAAGDAEYILVAAGLYQENLLLPPGVALHGGYASDFLSRNIVLFETELAGVQPLPGDLAVAPVHVEGITGPAGVVVSGFSITGYDVDSQTPSGNGAASIAVYVLDSDEHFALRNCRVSGGFGGAAATGPGGATGFGTQAAGGGVLDGASGAVAGPCALSPCLGESQAGGAGGTNPSCGAASASAGGGVVCPEYNQPAYTPGNPGHDGASGWNWTFDSGSNNVCSGHATEAGYPTAIKKMDGGDGLSGAEGATGIQGAGCTQSEGVFAGGLWTGIPGAAGQAGAAGQSGGAGGAAGGLESAPQSELPPGVSAKSPPLRHKLGATGGGGGAGGCGGASGGGGGAGGASIAVLVGWSAPGGGASPPVLATNRILRGVGGAGGSGGYGGLGGVGGDGGLGGDSQSFWIDFRAGSGGRGGNGGAGGGGGGGCGGPSFGVAVFQHPAGWALDYAGDNEFIGGDLPTGGPGGMGGPSGIDNPASQGVDGAWADLHLVPAP
jgi:hypothetical protein